jgi:hypothetical protein
MSKPIEANIINTQPEIWDQVKPAEKKKEKQSQSLSPNSLM